jgi:PBP1b-binding outer membrane lipoprotein LpoB
MESPMKIYSIAVLMALVLAGCGAFVLSSIQETVAQANTTGSARLDYQEAVNSYGREDPSVYGR